MRKNDAYEVLVNRACTAFTQWRTSGEGTETNITGKAVYESVLSMVGEMYPEKLGDFTLRVFAAGQGSPKPVEAYATAPTVTRRVSDRVGMKGADHPMAVLTDAIVIDCRERHRRGERMSDLAREYEIGPSGMTKAVRGETWAHLDDVAAPVPVPSGGQRVFERRSQRLAQEAAEKAQSNKLPDLPIKASPEWLAKVKFGNHKLFPEAVTAIRQYAREGHGTWALARFYGCSEQTVVSAATGESWKGVPEPVVPFGELNTTYQRDDAGNGGEERE